MQDKATLEIYKHKLELDVSNDSIELDDMAIRAMEKNVEVEKYIKNLLRAEYLSLVPRNYII